MVITYRIKRFDLVKTYFHNLRYSRRTQIIIFGTAALLGLLILFTRYINFGTLSINDFANALMIALGFFLVIPVLNILTAKTQRRALTIDPQGIETKIGSKEGHIPWKAVESIAVSKDLIIITGKNSNSFVIPLGAFANTQERQSFIDLASQYLDETKRNQP